MIKTTGDITLPKVKNNLITSEQIEKFKRDGILVISGLVTKELIETTSSHLHQELLKYGVDHENLENTAENLRKLSSTGGAGGILDIFYPSWRFQLAENENIFGAISDLWNATYATCQPGFEHPYGPFNGKEGYIYINRVCYRVPDFISTLNTTKRSKVLQRSLTPHLDCCPSSLHDSKKTYPRWRPIQCITALTDNVEPSTGGFEAVKGFHREFSSYFKDKAAFVSSRVDTMNRPPVCLGDFSPLRTQEDKDLIKRMSHIPYKKGDVIFWDWRIPHANSYKHVGKIPREVVYTGFLPNVPINREYVKEQLYRYQHKLLPSDHWQKDSQGSQTINQDIDPHHFTSLGSRLIGLYSWEETCPSQSKA